MKRVLLSLFIMLIPFAVSAQTERKAERAGKVHNKTYNTDQGGGDSSYAQLRYISVKTNMLYDLALIPNIGAEYYLGNGFSAVANAHFSWWSIDSKAWFWRTLGGDVALRYWFGKASQAKPLTGHHVGIYAQTITYDFELGGKGIQASKLNWSVGAEYGYSLPITRRLNLDFTAGIGYHWGEFDEYTPLDGHFTWMSTKRRKYFGPTKLEVSLVWLLGNGNINSNKAGKR